MDLMVEHLLVEVHRCLSSFFPTRFSGWPTSSSAGMMPPYEAQGELPRIPIPRTRVNNGVRAGVVRLRRSMDIGELPSTLASTPPPSGHWAPPLRVSA